MNDYEFSSIGSGYDEDDDDCDFDEFLESLDDESESFEDRLKSHNTDLEKLREVYSEFTAKYDLLLKRIGAKAADKLTVCRALSEYADANGFDDDIIMLWCVCMSENSDFIFTHETDERCCLYNFMALSDDIEKTVWEIKNEKRLGDEFESLTKKITFEDAPAAEIGIDKLYHFLSIEAQIDGEFFEDNLHYLTEKICHSPELVKVAPLVYYSLIERQRKKMLTSPDYDPNWSNVLRREERQIDTDNGKNIDNFCEHIGIYELACRCIDDSLFDKSFCDIGFARMSNIPECSLVPWENYPTFERPVYSRIRDSYFTCFPNGLNDNPIFAANDIHYDDMTDFEFYDDRQPKSRKILGKVRAYIKENEHICNDYCKLVQSGETDKLYPIILDVTDNSGIDTKHIKPELIDIVNAVITDEIMKRIDEIVKGKMLDLLSAFKEEF